MTSPSQLWVHKTFLAALILIQGLNPVELSYDTYKSFSSCTVLNDPEDGTCNPTNLLEICRINYAYPLVFNSIVEYSYDYGFGLVGPERKLVDDAPVCEEIDCFDVGSWHNWYIKGYSSRLGFKRELKFINVMKFVEGHQHSMFSNLENGQMRYHNVRLLDTWEVTSSHDFVRTLVLCLCGSAMIY